MSHSYNRVTLASASNPAAPLDPIALAAGYTAIAAGVWCLRTTWQSETAMCDAIRAFGAACGRHGGALRIERLTPRSSVDAPRNSLSGRFGLGAFPLHTDLAHRVVPPRLLILAAAHVVPGSARTILCSAPPLGPPELDAVASGIFIVANGRQSFLGSIYQRGRHFLRFDSACMKPIDSSSREALRLFASVLGSRGVVTEYAWTAGDILIIDNWTTLHGRSAVADISRHRVLLRAYIEDIR